MCFLCLCVVESETVVVPGDMGKLTKQVGWGLGYRIVNDGRGWWWQSRDWHRQGTDPVNWPDVHGLHGPCWPGYYVTGL